MKNILKRLVICAVAVLLVNFFGIDYVKADDMDTVVEFDNIKYRVNYSERWLAVCGYTGNDKDVVIPSVVEKGNVKGFIVSEIDDLAFNGCSSIEILNLPDTIMKVGETSFLEMDNLQAVISKAKGINIIVTQNVKIVTSRDQLDNESINNDDNKPTSSDNGSNNNSEQVNNGTDNSSSNLVDSAEGIIGIGSNNESGSIDINVNETKADGTKVTGETVSTTDNKNGNRETSANSINEKTQNKTTKKSSAPKIIAYIICVIVIIGLAAGAIIFIKKKRR